MGLLEKIFVVVNLILAVGICVAIGSSLETVTNYKTDADRYMKMHNDSLTEIKILKADNDAITRQKNAMEIDFASKASDLDTERNTLTTKVEAAEKENADLRNRLTESEKVRNDAMAEAAASRNKLTDMEKQNQGMQTRVAAVEAEMTDLQIKTGEAYKKLKDDSDATINQLNDTIKQLQIELAAAKGGNGVEMPEILGKVTGEPITSTLTGDTILTITTDKGSQPARVGYRFEIYRESEGIYLGNGVVESVVKELEEGSQLLTVIIKNPDPARKIKMGDSAATKIPSAAR